MICFLCFTVLYYLIAGGVARYCEDNLRLSSRYKNEDRKKAKSLDRGVTVANFSNAIISTILSSISLYCLNSQQRTDIYLTRPSSIAQWTIESVCGYIFVEFTFIFGNKYRLSAKYWRLTKRAVMHTLIFHSVALLGLSSVLLFDTGYAIALWVIWSELTSVFLTIEEYMEETIIELNFPLIFQIVKTCTSVIFVLQRIVLFLGLLWLCGQQFTWQPLFLLQLLILCLGTVLNVLFVIERVSAWIYL